MERNPPRENLVVACDHEYEGREATFDSDAVKVCKHCGLSQSYVEWSIADQVRKRIVPPEIAPDTDHAADVLRYAMAVQYGMNPLRAETLCKVDTTA